MAEGEKIIGIDLGTTNSVVAVVESGESKVIPNPEGNRIFYRVKQDDLNNRRKTIWEKRFTNLYFSHKTSWLIFQGFIQSVQEGLRFLLYEFFAHDIASLIMVLSRITLEVLHVADLKAIWPFTVKFPNQRQMVRGFAGKLIL